jgi:lysozyme
MTVRDLVLKHEGLKLFPYTDSVGKKTIGVGHCLDVVPLPADYYEPDGSISEATAMEVFDEDLDKATAAVIRLTKPWFPQLNDARAAVLIDMAFEMGEAGLAGFAHMLGCLSAGNWVSAGAAAMQSKWASQVPDRALEDAVMLRTGKWPGE